MADYSVRGRPESSSPSSPQLSLNPVDLSAHALKDVPKLPTVVVLHVVDKDFQPRRPGRDASAWAQIVATSASIVDADVYLERMPASMRRWWLCGHYVPENSGGKEERRPGTVRIAPHTVCLRYSGKLVLMLHLPAGAVT